MKKAIFVLLCALVVVYCADNAHAGFSDSGSTTGWNDESIHQSLAEEFAKCSAFSGIAARCAGNDARPPDKKAAAQYEDVAKRFYKGSYMLAGQTFTRQRIQFHDTAMRRNAGRACEGFPKLEQQHRRRCDDTYKRLPRKLQ